MKPLLREGLLSFLGLVVLGRVDGVFGEEFAGAAGGDEGVGAVDEQDDWGAGVGAADAEVSEPTGVADGDGADIIHGVVADSPVLVAVAESGFVFGECAVGFAGGAAAGGAVWAVFVVEVLEVAEPDPLSRTPELRR